jgi:hypothetical protein
MLLHGLFPLSQRYVSFMMAIVEIENLGRRLSSENEYLSGTPSTHSGTAYGVHGATSFEFNI